MEEREYFAKMRNVSLQRESRRALNRQVGTRLSREKRSHFAFRPKRKHGSVAFVAFLKFARGCNKFRVHWRRGIDVGPCQWTKSDGGERGRRPSTEAGGAEVPTRRRDAIVEGRMNMYTAAIAAAAAAAAATTIAAIQPNQSRFEGWFVRASDTPASSIWTRRRVANNNLANNNIVNLFRADRAATFARLVSVNFGELECSSSADSRFVSTVPIERIKLVPNIYRIYKFLLNLQKAKITVLL